jgi:hypothetical protein
MRPLGDDLWARLDNLFLELQDRVDELTTSACEPDQTPSPETVQGARQALKDLDDLLIYLQETP